MGLPMDAPADRLDFGTFALDVNARLLIGRMAARPCCGGGSSTC